MTISIRVLHLLKSSGSRASAAQALMPGQPHQRWTTCLRDIVFVPRSATLQHLEGLEIYDGDDAYKFCLQVISGLHSQLLGETEVLGQFKIFCEALTAQNPFHNELRAFAKSLLVDVKKVRTEYLTDLGSQGYGSLARLWVQGTSEIHILGYGHLAREIEPWLGKTDVPVVFHVRRPQNPNHQDLMTPPSAPRRGALIVAAPLSDEELAAWLPREPHALTMLIDFRDHSRRETFADLFATVYVLQDAFAQVESGRAYRMEQATLANQSIEELVQQRAAQQLIRPFGWEDLCA